MQLFVLQLSDRKKLVFLILPQQAETAGFLSASYTRAPTANHRNVFGKPHGGRAACTFQEPCPPFVLWINSGS